MRNLRFACDRTVEPCEIPDLRANAQWNRAKIEICVRSHANPPINGTQSKNQAEFSLYIMKELAEASSNCIDYLSLLKLYCVNLLFPTTGRFNSLSKRCIV